MLSTNCSLGIILLNPWLVHNSLEAMATYPIGAREEKRTLPFGSILQEQLLYPSDVIILSPREI